jgi:hypothetical protein
LLSISVSTQIWIECCSNLAPLSCAIFSY